MRLSPLINIIRGTTVVSPQIFFSAENPKNISLDLQASAALYASSFLSLASRVFISPEHHFCPFPTMSDNGTEMEDLEAMLASDAQGGGDEGEFGGALRGGPTVPGGGAAGGGSGDV